jgi:iron complex outermembrane receptor protein
MRKVRMLLSAASLTRCSALVLTAACTSTSVHAQATEEGTQAAQGKEGTPAKQDEAKAPKDAPAEKAGDAGSDDTVRLAEEIVVTARRRAERLQDTPIAISAFSADTLLERQIQQTEDLERITPNLQFKPAGQLSGNTAASVVFIRGVGQLDPTAAVDPGVGIYLNEVYLGRAVGSAIEFDDIASVEVLRGPQGTLFGRNTIGGAILVRTRQPEIGDFNSKLRLRVGQDGLYEGFAAAFNLPLGDKLAARFSGALLKRRVCHARV